MMNDFSSRLPVLSSWFLVTDQDININDEFLKSDS